MPTQLSSHDEHTIQIAAHGVVTLMTSCVPGVIGVVTASRATSAAGKAMSTTTGVTGRVLANKPPKLPFTGSIADIAAIVLPALTDSVAILDHAQQGEGDNFLPLRLRRGADSPRTGLRPHRVPSLTHV